MTTLYKLTTAEWTTKNNTLWGPNVTHTASGEGRLCTSGWLHAYLSPELAHFLNPIHANLNNYVLWRCEGNIGKTDGQRKVGCTSLTTIEIIEYILPTTEQRVKFAILCGLKVYSSPKFVKWANNWLNNIDRTADAAYAAADAYAANLLSIAKEVMSSTIGNVS